MIIVSLIILFRLKNFISVIPLEHVRKGGCGLQKVKWLAKFTHLISDSFCLLIPGQVIYCFYCFEAPCYNGINTGFEVRDTWVLHKDLKFMSHAIQSVSSNFLNWERDDMFLLTLLHFKWDEMHYSPVPQEALCLSWLSFLIRQVHFTPCFLKLRENRINESNCKHCKINFIS